MRCIILVILLLATGVAASGQVAACFTKFRGKVVAYDALLGQENPSAIPFVEMVLLKLESSDKVVRLKVEYRFERDSKVNTIRRSGDQVEVLGVRDLACDSTLNNAAFAKSFIIGTTKAGPPIARLEYLDSWRPINLKTTLECYKVEFWKTAGSSQWIIPDP